MAIIYFIITAAFMFLLWASLSLLGEAKGWKGKTFAAAGVIAFATILWWSITGMFSALQ